MPLIHASDRPRPGRPLQGQHRLQRVQRRLAVGRIYERRGFSPDIRWEWSVHGIVLRRSPRIRSNGCSGRAWVSESRASEVLGRVEGVGEAGGGALASLSPPAALPNSRRFFVILLCGATAIGERVVSAGGTIASGTNSLAAVLVMPRPNLRRRNAAAFCASNPS